MYDLQNIVKSDNIDKLNVRVYRNGTGVIYFDKFVSPENEKPPKERNEQRQRKFHMNRTKVQSATLAAWANKRSKYMLFLTFTFPWNVSEIVGARVWKLTLDSLRNNYNVKNYCWVKEYQKIGRIHYHILIDRNRIGIKNLQKTYNSHIRNITGRDPAFSNSVRLGPNPIVRYPEKVKTYLSKYIGKGNDEYDRRCFGFSEGFRLYKTIDISDIIAQITGGSYGSEFITLRKGVKIIHVDSFFCVFKFVNYADFDP